MRYLVSCECGQSVPVSPGQAGQAVRCACQRMVSVPELRELRRLPTAPEPDVEPTRAFHWGPREVVFFVGVLLTAITLLAVVVLAIGRSRLSIHWTANAQAEVDSQVIDSLGVDEVHSNWLDMRREGLGGQNPHSHMFGESDAVRISSWIRWLLLFAAPVGGLTIGLGLRLWLDRRGAANTRR